MVFFSLSSFFFFYCTKKNINNFRLIIFRWSPIFHFFTVPDCDEEMEVIVFVWKKKLPQLFTPMKITIINFWKFVPRFSRVYVNDTFFHRRNFTFLTAGFFKTNFANSVKQDFYIMFSIVFFSCGFARSELEIIFDLFFICKIREFARKLQVSSRRIFCFFLNTKEHFDFQFFTSSLEAREKVREGEEIFFSGINFQKYDWYRIMFNRFAIVREKREIYPYYIVESKKMRRMMRRRDIKFCEIKKDIYRKKYWKLALRCFI